MNRLIVWRHPKADGAHGRCIGRTDLAVDPRRAKRLAHRIRALARREQLARVVHTSPLARCAQVGRWLRRFGFVHHVDADLAEMDFGAWEGREWRAIGVAEVTAWEQDFVGHAPGGGESLAQLFERVRGFCARHAGARLVVTHAGWITAWCWLQRRPQETPTASRWPAPPRHGQRIAGPQNQSLSITPKPTRRRRTL
jgi:alpha-ribazole phosphatase